MIWGTLLNYAILGSVSGTPESSLYCVRYWYLDSELGYSTPTLRRSVFRKSRRDPAKVQNILMTLVKDCFCIWAEATIVRLLGHMRASNSPKEVLFRYVRPQSREYPCTTILK